MMKKRCAQLFICALTVGIATIAGITGIATIKGVETTETVEYAMEENEAFLTDSYPLNILPEPVILIKTNDRVKNITECGSIGEVVRGLPKNSGLGYKRLYIKGYDGEVLAITGKLVKKDEKNTSCCAWFYTKAHGEHVHYVGSLNTNNENSPLRIKDGIINASNEYTYNTYIMTSDGKKFFEKDAMKINNEHSIKGFLSDKNDCNNRTYYNERSDGIESLISDLNKKTKNSPFIDFEAAR